MKNITPFENFGREINEKKKYGTAEKGLMHELLRIPEDKKISDVYKKKVEDYQKTNLAYK